MCNAMGKRRKISVEDKMRIIRCFEKGESNSLISQKFNLSSSTVSTILKNHKVITEAYQKNQVNARRLRKADKADLDDALFSWLNEQKNLNVPLSRKMLKEQAEILAVQLGYENFVCGHSWLDRFKNRHKFQYGVCENSTVPKIDHCWLEIWPNLKMDYSECDIFIVDVTEVSFKLTSSTNIINPGDDLYKCDVVLCVNMTGSEKRELIVIGKDHEPVENLNLPVIFYQNAEDTSMSQIVECEIQKWDLELQTRGRAILLLLGNLNFEVKINLANIRIVNVPYDSVSVLNEIGMNFESNFRGILLDNQIRLRKVKPRSRYQLSVAEGLNYLKEAWDKITPDKIVICLRTAGLTQSEIPEQSFEFLEMGESSYKTEEMWDENNAAGPSGITHLEIDCDAVKYEPNDENSEEMKVEPPWDDIVKDEDEEGGSEDYTIGRVSESKAQEAIRILELFYESNRGINPAFKTHLNKLKGILGREKF